MQSEHPSIPFSKAVIVDQELEYIRLATQTGALAGDHSFTAKCNDWLEQNTGAAKALLTTSGTHALEMAALLLNLKPGDEIILPSFTFSSSANAFALRGAQLVFIDIRPDTMNLDEKLLASAITGKTRAVLPVHYAGVACEMDEIIAQCAPLKISVIEDAAQAILSEYKGRPLGALGDFGCLSFHETKNITCGEGGAFLSRHPEFTVPAEVIREKGTNRAQFFRGQVDKYRWLDIGSSYLPSELNAAFLLSQLENAQRITRDRERICSVYSEQLVELEQSGKIELAHPPIHCKANAHIFYLKTKDLSERTALLQHLKSHGISATFHYVPLHSAPAGLKFGRFVGEDRYTTKESERLLRLPLWFGLETDKLNFICDQIKSFYRNR